LEQTDDYRDVPLLRWYLVYRAMVRAKVAAIRSQQPGQSHQDIAKERRESLAHVTLADRLASSPPPRLWITHGVSGSGKTTGSQHVVEQLGAIRLRSDIQRKRLFGLTPSQRPEGALQKQVYSSAATEQTYDRLKELTSVLLRSGESVVVDATFLKREQRDLFRNLADKERVPFTILAFQADRAELEQRIAARLKKDDDASDATLQVLESQLQSVEPLGADERRLTEAP
jgi:predicted kinase